MKFLLILFTFAFSSTTTDLGVIRAHFKVANSSKEKAQAFYDLFDEQGSASALHEAYRGAAITLRAKNSSDLLHKKKYATEGLTILEKSIAQEPKNVEMRLIRLSIQEHAPRILKYSSNIEEDRKMIVDGYKKEPKSVQELIKDYSLQSKVFTEADKQNF
ncbi:hypothetical protein [Flavobacterium sp. JP2137]|uniref:hypothetical protein n=1 Tax=Flavobacterium sp. JP2137 TaxID=3414510 RepID=UPI003D2FE550